MYIFTMIITTSGSPSLAGNGLVTTKPWHMTLGAQVEPGGVRFRVWAPKRERVDVVINDLGKSFPLEKDDAGYFSCLMPTARAGMTYRYRLDNGAIYPDPCSRFQPSG